MNKPFVKILPVLCATALFISAPPAAYAADTAPDKLKLTMTTGFDYTSGDYGQTIDTQITTVPVTAKLKYGRWTGKLTVPYISITGPGVVVGGSGGEGGGSDGGGGGSGSDGGGENVGTAGPKRTESGLGDVLASLAYTMPLYGNDTIGTVLGKVKFPTADKDRNLGTGEFDYTLQGGVTQNIQDFYVSGNVGRKFNGSSAQFPLDDVWKFSLGAGVNVTPGTVAGVDYDFRQSATATGDNVSEATAFVTHNLASGWGVQVYAMTGFTDASPNWGGGLQLSYMLDPVEPRAR